MIKKQNKKKSITAKNELTVTSSEDRGWKYQLDKRS